MNLECNDIGTWLVVDAMPGPDLLLGAASRIGADHGSAIDGAAPAMLRLDGTAGRRSLARGEPCSAVMSSAVITNKRTEAENGT